MKTKIIKMKVGEFYDKDLGSKPVYRTYWQQPDGSYMAVEKLWVSEVEKQEAPKGTQTKVEA